MKLFLLLVAQLGWGVATAILGQESGGITFLLGMAIGAGVMLVGKETS